MRLSTLTPPPSELVQVRGPFGDLSVRVRVADPGPPDRGEREPIPAPLLDQVPARLVGLFRVAEPAPLELADLVHQGVKTEVACLEPREIGHVGWFRERWLRPRGTRSGDRLGQGPLAFGWGRKRCGRRGSGPRHGGPGRTQPAPFNLLAEGGEIALASCPAAGAPDRSAALEYPTAIEARTVTIRGHESATHRTVRLNLPRRGHNPRKLGSASVGFCRTNFRTGTGRGL
jgi:hypothetical protein